ncbi:MAG: ABC transporter ATP-binding protein [Elusimicrobiota bacterium]
MSKIIFEKVSKVYRNLSKDRHIQALNNVSFSVNESEIVVLIGPSGCGKSTILNMIAGFIFPTAGRVLFNGSPVSAPGAERTIIFQEYALFPWYTVKKNVEFGLAAKGMSKNERSKLADELLYLVRLEHVANFYPYQLSGGMKQRVAIVRALVVEPEVLLMDEPFGALDAQTRNFLQRYLLKVWNLKKTTIVYVTHSIEEALTLGHKILVLSRQPARIIEEIEIKSPFPRDHFRDTELQKMKYGIGRMLQAELKRSK